MTEQARNHESHERHDPELQDINDRLGVIVDVLGYEETDEVREARTAFVREVSPDGYDHEDPRHIALRDAHYAAAQESLAGDREPERSIGFEVALLQLWLDCDEPYEFHAQLGRYEDEGPGVVSTLRGTPGFDAHLVELLAIVDDLEALNKNNRRVPQLAEPKSRL